MGSSCECILNNAREVRYRGRLGAEIVIVGDSPNTHEVRMCEPFLGPAGQLLVTELKAVGINEVDCLFANSARCMLEKDKLKTKELNSILAACRSKLERIIEAVKPKVILSLGAVAAQQIMKKKISITKNRGQFLWSEEFQCYVFLMFHPAYILRNESMRGKFSRDLKKLADFIDNDYQIIAGPNIDWEEVDSIQHLLDGGFMRDPLDTKYMVTAIDTETQGLDWYRNDSIVISYSVAENTTKGIQVYLNEEVEKDQGDFNIVVYRGGTKKNPKAVTVGIKRSNNYDQKIAELKELCRRGDIKKYFMNQKYDLHRLEQVGVTEFVNMPLDIAVAAHTLDCERYTNAHLKDLTEDFTNLDSGHKDDFTSSEKADMLLQARDSRDKVSKYAALDAVVTLSAALNIRKDLMKDDLSLGYFLYFSQPIETRFLYTLEKNGILIDVNRLPEVSKELRRLQSEQVAEFKKYCPSKVIKKHAKNFRLTRRAILIDSLFKYIDKDGSEVDIGFGYSPIEYSTKTNSPKCDKEVLRRLLGMRISSGARKMIEAYQLWDKYNGMQSRYIGQITDNLDSKGRIHPSYSITYTTSGRTGARRPSIQNFPKRSAEASFIRELIIAPKGKILVEIDHSTAELRWIAEVADEKTMKRIFAQGADLHLETGLEIASIDSVEGLSKDEIKKIRSGAKAFNFGLSYKMSPKGLKEYSESVYGVKISLKEAEEKSRKFFDKYKALEHWHKSTNEMLYRNGYLRTIFGRKRILPDINSTDRMLQLKAERSGLNGQIQGPSSDYTLLGGYNVTQSDWYDGDSCKIVAFIHDAFIFEIDENKLDFYLPKIQETMTKIDTSNFNFSTSVPFKVDVEVGKNLAHMSEVKNEQG